MELKPSIQSLEGKLVLGLNIAYAIGVFVAAVLDLALHQPIFSRYIGQIMDATYAIATLNGAFLAARTYLKGEAIKNGDNQPSFASTTTSEQPV